MSEKIYQINELLCSLKEHEIYMLGHLLDQEAWENISRAETLHLAGKTAADEINARLLALNSLFTDVTDWSS
jgi:hypothetical protein